MFHFNSVAHFTGLLSSINELVPPSTHRFLTESNTVWQDFPIMETETKLWVTLDTVLTRFDPTIAFLTEKIKLKVPWLLLLLMAALAFRIEAGSGTLSSDII